jgi:NADH:ubiquinone oxidoreductase subunit F (NADH-binding)/NAD-dependent dihydropyrimidine dehydrogenase PreA subunit/(2Fe-2S) ferredoxin
MKIKSMNKLLSYRSTLSKPLAVQDSDTKDIEIFVGMGTCDIAAGAKEKLEALQQLVQKHNLDNIRVSSVGCIGFCSEEPTVEIHIPDREPLIYSKITADKAEELFDTVVIKNGYLDDSLRIKSFHHSPVYLQNPMTLLISPANDSHTELINYTKKRLVQKGLHEKAIVITTGKTDLDVDGYVVKVQPDNVLYANIKTVLDIDEIIYEHIKMGRVVERLLVKEDKDSALSSPHQIDFYKKQFRIALRNCGFIDPEKIDEYISAKGYEALGLCLTEKTPKDVIEIIKQSKLRGLGGGGFPTGSKWEFTARENSDVKYIICNADEGDPGAFMDRSILEGDPHSVIEAMIIAGYAIGSNHGIVYIRAEYPLAIKRLEIALEQSREYGCLGTKIFGTKFDFDIEIRLGAGAFVCGEETALINSLEGGRGEPRKKPPFPSVSGYKQKPTSVNNVETFANIAPIILKGPTWFASIGTKNSLGTIVFAIAGKVNNVGLVEVPMGTTLREIIFDIGGGISGGKRFKALQTGGPSGGVVTEQHLDTPIDYESLKAIGSMMGSGGMIVLDEDDDMVQLSKFYLDFTQDESCGKCTPCRIGTKRLYEILDRLTKMEGFPEDLDILQDLCWNIKNSALCGLGQTAPNPILSTLEYFRKEYDAYAYRTKRLSFIIIADKCIGCTKCSRVCPVACITGTVKQPHVIDESECIACGACYDACPVNAIERP